MSLTTASDSTSITTVDSHRAVPSSGDLLRAFHAVPAGGHIHPLLAEATRLGRQHRLRAVTLQALTGDHTDDHATAAATRSLLALRHARLELVERVDRWAAAQFLQRPVAAALCTETVGQVVDRLAMDWAWWRLMEDSMSGTSRPVDANVTSRAELHQVGTLSAAYDDLTRELVDGRRALPRSPAASSLQL
jgi:hypothetical protein